MKIGQENLTSRHKLLITSLIVTGLLGLSVGVLLIKPWEKKLVKPVFGEIPTEFCLNEMCLNKKDGSWTVNKDGKVYQADKESAENFLKTMGKIRLDELVSTNPERFSELGIGMDNALVLKSSNTQLEIGNITNEYDGSYVRLKDKNEVYKTKEILSKLNLADIGKWKIKYLINMPIYQINKITVDGLNGKKVLEKKGDNWENQNYVEKAAYLPVVNELIDYKAQTKEIQEISIEANGETEKVKLGKDPKRRNVFIYWATKDSLHFFEIEKSTFETLTGKIK